MASVYEPGGIKDAWVNVYDLSNNNVYITFTYSDGLFNIFDLPAGTYRILCEAPEPYVDQWYNGKSDFAAADNIVVTAGHETSGINIMLERPGRITGRVTSASETGGVANVLVYSYDLDHCVADIAVTDAGGYYTLENMETGSYAVRFETRRASGAYLDQWYSGRASFSAATPVQVNFNQITQGINVSLQQGTESRYRAAVMMGSDAGSYGSATNVAEFLEGRGFEVEWLLSGNPDGFERSNVEWKVIEEGLSTAKIIYYCGHGIYHGTLPNCRVGGFYTLGYFIEYPELSKIDFAENAVVMFANACFTAGDHSAPVSPPSTDEEKKSFIAMYANDFMGWERGDYFNYGSWQIDYDMRNLGFAIYYANNYGVSGFLEKLFSNQDYRLDELIDEGYVEDPFRYNDESDPANPMHGDYRMLLPNSIGSIALVGNMNLTTKDIIPPVPAPPVPAGYDTVRYFAEGYTGFTFREYLTLGNPTTSQAEVQVLYLFPNGDWKAENLVVPAGSRTTVDVNSVVGADKEVSMRVASNQEIVAERPMYFVKQGTGGSNVLGASSPSATWYFAEGYTGNGFEEYICVLNPGNQQAELTFRFQTQEAGEIVKNGFTVPANSRATFFVNDLLGSDYQSSLKLEASQPVVAERPMYFYYQGNHYANWSGGHCVMGATSLSNSYYFAEGTTRGCFEEYLTLQNPGTVPITIEAVYQLSQGQGDPITKSYKVDPGRRYTVIVPDEIGWEKDVSIKLTSSSQFLAERPMYFSYDNVWSGGHCVIGATDPGADWFFAEGYTGERFHEWLCLQNPGDSVSTVEITYYTQEAGTLPVKTVVVPARTRVTIKVNDHAGSDYQLSTSIHVESGPGIVAERPMYFNYNRAWDGGHDVVGYQP